MLRSGTRVVLMTVACGLALAGVGGCDDDDDLRTPAGTTPEEAALADARIFGVLVVANQGEVQAGRVAEVRTIDERARAFATQMVVEHSAALERGAALQAQTGLVPVETDLSQALRADTEDTLRLLEASGPNIDLVYMCSQVRMHRMVLQLIDTQLLPSAQSEPLRQELLITRPAVAGHLAEAEALVGALQPGQVAVVCEPFGGG
jgi:putative membrane protein